jgi:hypothetical protein
MSLVYKSLQVYNINIYSYTCICIYFLYTLNLAPSVYGGAGDYAGFAVSAPIWVGHPMIELGYENSVPFFLLKGHNGARLRANLLQKGLVVRDCASFGLPEWCVSRRSIQRKTRSW